MKRLDSLVDSELRWLRQRHPDIDVIRDHRGIIHLLRHLPDGRAVTGHVHPNQRMTCHDLRRRLTETAAAVMEEEAR